MAPLSLLASPGLGKHEGNRYAWLLYSHLRELGVQVEDFSGRRLLRGGASIWHLHWPEAVLQQPTERQARVKVAALMMFLEVARIRRMRIVWTAHNLATHEARYPSLEDRFWRFFTKRLDAIIHLSRAGQQAVFTRFPVLQHVPGFVIPHGHYRGAYPDNVTRAQARQQLGIAPDSVVISAVGRIRRYKALPELVRVFRQMPAPGPAAVLIVAGRPSAPALATELREAAGGDGRVRLLLDHLADDKLQVPLRAADLVALPYEDVLNSGAAILALSFDVPVLVPARGSMQELREQVGASWVKTYDGRLTPELLGAAARDAARQPGRERAPLNRLDWPPIAAATLDAYRDVLKRRRTRDAS